VYCKVVSNQHSSWANEGGLELGMQVDFSFRGRTGVRVGLVGEDMKDGAVLMDGWMLMGKLPRSCLFGDGGGDV
jgi:hypothetical protein